MNLSEEAGAGPYAAADKGGIDTNEKHQVKDTKPGYLYIAESKIKESKYGQHREFQQ